MTEAFEVTISNEEAIFCEKSYLGETNCVDCKYYGTDTCKSRESHKMAIAALKKEIPKPISIENGFVKCGGCGMYIRFPIADHYNNCPECGQKIGWIPIKTRPMTEEETEHCDDAKNKTKEQVQQECEYGDVFTTEEFWKCVEDDSFNEYDGIGYYHDGENETDLCIWDYPYRTDMPYVCWYNK